MRDRPEFLSVSTWDGPPPVARSIEVVRIRQPILVTGTIDRTNSTTYFGRPALRCRLDDGTGTIGLLFLGRSKVTGIADGCRCTISGTARGSGAGLVVWNPQFRLE
jgi:hypothetical protein